VCLRNARYTDRAIEQFEAALKLDNDLVEARGGLATVYEEKGYYNKVIELELTNIDIVNRKLSNKVQSAEDGNRLRKVLCKSHEAVADSFQEMGNVPMALRNWRKAAQTGEMADWTMIKYLNLLTECTEDSRWEHIIQLLQFLQGKPTITGQDRLTTYIFEEMWPVNLPQKLFFSAATAAKETNNLKWLICVYKSAINAAAVKSHMSGLILKLCVVKLHQLYTSDYASAEPLIEKIAQVAGIEHDPPIEDLERCKQEVAGDYCRTQVRNAFSNDSDAVGCSRYVSKVVNLIRSGIAPEGMLLKMKYQEHSLLYSASL
jgi:tetratricopeptide (TPR) repeat protein